MPLQAPVHLALQGVCKDPRRTEPSKDPEWQDRAVLTPLSTRTLPLEVSVLLTSTTTPTLPLPALPLSRTEGYFLREVPN